MHGFFFGGGGHFCFYTATSMLPRSSDFSLPRSSSYTTKRWQRCVLVKCRVLVSQVDVRTFVIPTEILQIKDLNTRPHLRFTCHALVIVFCHFCISMPLMFICCLCSILMICFASIHCHCCSSATNKSFYKTTPLAFSWRRKKQQQQRTDDDKTSAPAAEEWAKTGNIFFTSADDTTLYCPGENLEQLLTTVAKESNPGKRAIWTFRSCSFREFHFSTQKVIPKVRCFFTEKTTVDSQAFLTRVEGLFLWVLNKWNGHYEIFILYLNWFSFGFA